MTVPVQTQERDDMNTGRQGIITEMKEIAPPGLHTLDSSTVSALRTMTARLLAASHGSATEEFNRFESIAQRSYELSQTRLRTQVAGKNILVTGGTGCIGTALLEELTQLAPARLVSVSRMQTTDWRAIADVEYLKGDVRSTVNLAQIFNDVQPDIVYHLAAQRDPGMAEVEMVASLATNVLGTKHILTQAAKHGSQVVYASTGKTVRPFTPDVYAASKKINEWMMANAATEGLLCSAARFTHVVDNSIIMRLINKWIGDGESIRLHGSEILFYLQSARESAQLLLNSGLEAEERRFTIQAIRDLGWPANLVDLTLGVLANVGKISPIYFAGFDSGYEEEAFPALYDPMYSGEVSPLINAIEAPDAMVSRTCIAFDRFTFEVDNTDAAHTSVATLIDLLPQGMSSPLQAQLHTAGWRILDARLTAVPAERRQRMVQRYEKWAAYQTRTPLNMHTMTTDALKQSLR